MGEWYNVDAGCISSLVCWGYTKPDTEVSLGTKGLFQHKG
jgi:hypothetical protein